MDARDRLIAARWLAGFDPADRVSLKPNAAGLDDRKGLPLFRFFEKLELGEVDLPPEARADLMLELAKVVVEHTGDEEIKANYQRILSQVREGLHALMECEMSDSERDMWVTWIFDEYAGPLLRRDGLGLDEVSAFRSGRSWAQTRSDCPKGVAEALMERFLAGSRGFSTGRSSIERALAGQVERAVVYRWRI